MQLNWSNLIKLDERNIKMSAPKQAGVYRLSAKNVNEEYNVFYVGQAADIQDRLLQHMSADEANSCIRNSVKSSECGFRFAIVPTQADRDGIEQFLYDHFKPKCNMQNPGKKSINVNLN